MSDALRGPSLPQTFQMENALLELLCSPEHHAVLRLAYADELTKINTLIRSRILLNRGGALIDQEIDLCLICDEEGLGFPVRDGLPVLLASESFSTL
jgi:uncharacterized protein YbaR (Trm112 family)